MSKEAQEEINELMLEQGIRELLYSFRKNGGDLDYCVGEIRKDFEKAGYRKLPKDKPPLLSDEEIINHTIPPRQSLTEYHKLLRAQIKADIRWYGG